MNLQVKLRICNQIKSRDKPHPTCQRNRIVSSWNYCKKKVTSQFCGDDIVTWVDALLAKGPRPWCSYHLQKKNWNILQCSKCEIQTYNILFHCRNNNHYQNKCISNPKLGYNDYWNNFNMFIFLAHLNRNSWAFLIKMCHSSSYLYIYIFLFCLFEANFNQTRLKASLSIDGFKF